MQARKLSIFAIFAVSVLFMYLLYMESPKSTVSDNKPAFTPNMPLPKTNGPVRSSSSSSSFSVLDSDQIEKEELDPLVPPPKASKNERIDWFRRQLPELEILNSTSKSKRFHTRVSELYNKNCSAQFFMVWLSPAKTFGPRKMLAVDTLFTTNPGACLAILSNSLDTPKGYTILKPLLDQGFNLIAVKNTPAEAWLKLALSLCS